MQPSRDCGTPPAAHARPAGSIDCSSGKPTVTPAPRNTARRDKHFPVKNLMA